MSTKQPDALRLADALASNYFDGKQGREVWDSAASELRRLHAENAALRARVQELGQMARDVNSRRVVEMEAQLASISPPEGMAGWISVDEMLPEWAARDDTPCFINHEEVPPTLTSETVLVALKGGGVRTDKLTTIEGKSAGWWHIYGERVIAWQKAPAPPLAFEAKEL